MNSLKKLYTNALAKPAAKLSLVAGGLLASGLAMADGEGAAATTQISAAQTTVAEIAAAVLTVYVSIKVFKLIRSAL
jgi:hypothetical protein